MGDNIDRNHEERSVEKSRDTVKSVVQGCAVETRASAMKPRIAKPLVVPGVVVAESSEGGFEDDQRKDSSLDKYRECAQVEKSDLRGKSSIHWFEVVDGILYRYFKRSDNAEIARQLAVPRRYRKQVLKLGHDWVMAGHMGVRKTYDRIMQNFYWPGIF